MYILNEKMCEFVKSQGQLKYYSEYCVLYVDREIGNYYYSLIPKYKPKQRQKYPPHITVVRLHKEKRPEIWGRYDGRTVEFEYLPLILEDNLYYFLPAFSPEIGRIRREMGLPYYREGFNSYHITIGNKKHYGEN